MSADHLKAKICGAAQARRRVRSCPAWRARLVVRDFVERLEVRLAERVEILEVRR